MAIDPAVRSIRVAKTLTDRFAELVRGPHAYDSAFAATSLGALELRIGEAQQIYPEIWGHLDDARTALAGRGIDVGAYDQIRVTEPRGSLGVSRVDVESYATTFTGHAFGLADEQVKTATFNVAGLQRAHAATLALMQAMPEVDWAGLARAEAAELHAAGSLGPINARSLVRWLALGGGAIVVLYAFWYFVVRDKPPDREALAERERAVHAARVAEVQHDLEAHPCDRAVLRELTSLGGPVPSPAEGDARCAAFLAQLTPRLDADPCNRALQREVTMASRWFGSSRATVAAAHYQELCAAAHEEDDQ